MCNEIPRKKNLPLHLPVTFSLFSRGYAENHGNQTWYKKKDILNPFLCRRHLWFFFRCCRLVLIKKRLLITFTFMLILFYRFSIFLLIFLLFCIFAFDFCFWFLPNIKKLIHNRLKMKKNWAQRCWKKKRKKVVRSKLSHGWEKNWNRFEPFFEDDFNMQKILILWHLVGPEIYLLKTFLTPFSFDIRRRLLSSVCTNSCD